MARSTRFIGIAVGAAALAAIVVLVLAMSPSHQANSAREPIKVVGPLLSRGYTEAPAGTAVIAGDPEGGPVLLELRIVDGQKVKRGDVIAVLSNYPAADVDVRLNESKLAKAQQQREAMVSGFRTAEIAMQEIVVKSEVEWNKLKILEMQRSSLPPDQKEIELKISEQNVNREKAKLRFQKETLASDLAQLETDIGIMTARLDNARTTREQALVRSPLNGLVTQIYTRQGELISGSGIAKIVDLSQLRILADVDDVHLDRVALGGKVEVTFRGDSKIYMGKITRVSPVVRRLKRSQADLGEGNVNLVEVEIALDESDTMPQVLSRETRVTFL
jgi:multidrug resistance efflux pump